MSDYTYLLLILILAVCGLGADKQDRILEAVEQLCGVPNE